VALASGARAQIVVPEAVLERAEVPWRGGNAAGFSLGWLVFGGRADTVAPVRACEAMAAPQPDRVRLVVYDHAPHAFDMRLPDRTVLGMRR